MKIERIGEKHGLLTVVSSSEHKTYGSGAFWVCICECGNKKVVASADFKNGDTKSCGCLRRERGKKRFTTHGLTDTKIHRTWKRMNDRCNPEYKHLFPLYAGKGIEVEWKSFSQFVKDMGESCSEHIRLHGERNTTIDRIDSAKNYSKTNCRWATYHVQSLNRRPKKSKYGQSK